MSWLRDRMVYAVWAIVAAIILGVLGFHYLFAAEATHPVWDPPPVPQLEETRRTEYNQWVILWNAFRDEIRETQAYADSTLRNVTIATCKLAGGVKGVRLTRSYGSGANLAGFAFTAAGQTYTDTCAATQVTTVHQYRVRVVDADSIWVTAHRCWGEATTNDSSTVILVVFSVD